MNRDNYYQVSGWMILDLGLSGINLSIYAIVYGFSQDGQSWFTGSYKYLTQWTGKSKPTVIKSVNSLVEDGFIIKESMQRNNITFNRYKVDLEVVKKLYHHEKNNTGGSKEIIVGGSKETLPNNNTLDNKEDNNISPERKKTPEVIAPEVDMFGNPTKTKKTLFRNSVLNDFSVFEKKFSEPDFKGVNLSYYFQSVKNWSDKKSTTVLRDQNGWIATARDFMLRDQKDGKLVKSEGVKSQQDELYLEYLKFNNGDT